MLEVKTNFKSQQQYTQENTGHGRVEKRIVSICHVSDGIRDWPGLKTLIRVESYRETIQEETTETRYYISSLKANAKEFCQRLRGYWDVENKVHYVKDVTFGEDKSRIRTTPLVQIWALARNFALNLYRDHQFKNMARTQRHCSFSLEFLKGIFRMK